MRLDLFLTETNMTESRTRAKNLIIMGKVFVNDQIVEKVAFDVKEGDNVRISEDYDASLGGIKLRKALQTFDLEVQGKKCLDIGASNGGFCDVLLDNGAENVIALDVGECALPLRLKQDERIIIMDKTNAKTLLPEHLPYTPEIITVDVSFISLTQILPNVFSCLAPNGYAVCLIKPQFECGKNALSKKGIVQSDKDVQKAIERIKSFCHSLNFVVRDTCLAPHPFDKKNQEYFIFLSKNIA